jgi:membrane protein
MEKVKDVSETVFQRADELTGGALSTLWRAYQGFNEADGPHIAGSLAYFTMFSLFPLLLALIAVGSFFLEGEEVQARVVQSVTRFVPISQEVIRSNVDQVVKQRGTVGLAGLVGLFWSGTAVFTILLNHLTSAWPRAEERGFVKRRLLGTVMGVFGVVIVVLTLTFISAPLFALLGRIGVGLPFIDQFLGRAIVIAVPVVVTFLMFTTLYRWGPNTEVRWREALWPALFVAVMWQIARRVFTWYVSSGLVQYRLVYGSLGAVVALLLWIYISSVLILFGAHLSAAIGRRRRETRGRTRT